MDIIDDTVTADRYHVVPAASGWLVVKEGVQDPLARIGDRERAIAFAKEAVIAGRALLVVHGPDGGVQEEFDFRHDPRHGSGELT